MGPPSAFIGTCDSSYHRTPRLIRHGGVDAQCRDAFEEKKETHRRRSNVSFLSELVDNPCPPKPVLNLKPRGSILTYCHDAPAAKDATASSLGIMSACDAIDAMTANIVKGRKLHRRRRLL